MCGANRVRRSNEWSETYPHCILSICRPFRRRRISGHWGQVGTRFFSHCVNKENLSIRGWILLDGNWHFSGENDILFSNFEPWPIWQERKSYFSFTRFSYIVIWFQVHPDLKVRIYIFLGNRIYFTVKGSSVNSMTLFW